MFALCATLCTVVAVAVLFLDGSLVRHPAGFRWALGGLFAFSAAALTLVTAAACRYESDRD